MIVSTFLFNSGLIHSLNILLVNIVVCLSMLYLLFLFFNIFIRIYNMCYNTFKYFYKVTESKILIILYYSLFNN
jgi:hypothetical protein